MTTWHKLSDRRPTAEDADSFGNVGYCGAEDEIDIGPWANPPSWATHYCALAKLPPPPMRENPKPGTLDRAKQLIEAENNSAMPLSTEHIMCDFAEEAVDYARRQQSKQHAEELRKLVEDLMNKSYPDLSFLTTAQRELHKLADAWAEGADK